MNVPILKSHIEKLIKIAKEENLGSDWKLEQFDLLSLFTEYCIYRNGFPFPNAVNFPKTFEFLYQNIYLPASKTCFRHYIPEEYVKKYFSVENETFSSSLLLELLNGVVRIGDDVCPTKIGTALWYNDILSMEIRYRMLKVMEKGNRDKRLLEILSNVARETELIDFDDFMLGKTPPTIRLVHAFCETYHCSADYLLGLKNEP